MARQIEMNFFSTDSAPVQINDSLDCVVDSSGDLNVHETPSVPSKKEKITVSNKFSLKSALGKLSLNSK